MKFTDNKLMLLCAFRYCLGRMTYVIPFMVENLVNNWDMLDEFHQNLIKKEILEHKERYGNVGSGIDDKEWGKILAL